MKHRFLGSVQWFNWANAPTASADIPQYSQNHSFWLLQNYGCLRQRKKCGLQQGILLACYGLANLIETIGRQTQKTKVSIFTSPSEASATKTSGKHILETNTDTQTAARSEATASPKTRTQRFILAPKAILGRKEKGM